MTASANDVPFCSRRWGAWRGGPQRSSNHLGEPSGLSGGIKASILLILAFRRESPDLSQFPDLSFRGHRGPTQFLASDIGIASCFAETVGAGDVGAVKVGHDHCITLALGPSDPLPSTMMEPTDPRWLSDPYGSWKTIRTSRRSVRSSSEGSARRSRPRLRIESSEYRSRRRALPGVDLPRSSLAQHAGGLFATDSQIAAAHLL